MYLQEVSTYFTDIIIKPPRVLQLQKLKAERDLTYNRHQSDANENS